MLSKQFVWMKSKLSIYLYGWYEKTISHIQDFSALRRFLYLLFWRETYPQTFPPEFLSTCEYCIQFLKKPACYRPFRKWHFVMVCTEKMMDHQYEKNGARNTYSNYNKMRAFVDSSPNQSKKLYFIDLSTKLWRFRKSTGRFCFWNLPDYCSSSPSL